MKTSIKDSPVSPATKHRAFWQSFWLAGVSCGGIIAALFGLAVLVVHSQTQGMRGNSPENWPESSRIGRNQSGFELVVFLHPHCPCGRATVREVEHLLERRSGFHTVVVMLRPEESPIHWERGFLWEWARSMKGIDVYVDQGGVEARRFGIGTSGHVCLYDGKGRLQFSGGITQSRGHEGENRGIAALDALLGGNQAVAQNPVFGCPLFSACERSDLK